MASSLRSKLDRLGAVGPTRSAAVPVLAQSTPEPEPVEAASSVEALRQKIARIIAKQAPSPKPPHDPSIGELPFIAHETPAGKLYVRALTFETNHRVGRFPLHTGRSANASMLSLLALDPSLASVDPAGALYLDTETTGLSGGTGTLPFLIGLGFFDDAHRFHIEQLLLRRPGEEAPILQRVAERVAKASMLVSYNGKAFDMPLVRTRFVMNRLPALPVMPHLDLLHVARRVHRGRIKSCTLGAVESHVLGFGRIDDVPSGEVCARYAHFLRTGDEGALLGVVEHNLYDVVSMAALLGLYGEPMDGLLAQDLAGVAATLHRAKSMESAAMFADEAVARGGGALALRARAGIAKARGDKALALADFEQLLIEVDDSSARLELAKLYEHYQKAFDRALSLAEAGTAEHEGAAQRRRARLKRKIARKGNGAQAVLPGVEGPAGRKSY